MVMVGDALLVRDFIIRVHPRFSAARCVARFDLCNCECGLMLLRVYNLFYYAPMHMQILRKGVPMALAPEERIAELVAQIETEKAAEAEAAGVGTGSSNA